MEKSMQPGATASSTRRTGFVMAMARWRLGEKDAALTLFNDAAAEMDKSKSRDEMSLRFCAEAAALLGRSDASKSCRQGDESLEVVQGQGPSPASIGFVSLREAASEPPAAKQSAHWPDISWAVGLRARGDGHLILSRTASDVGDFR